jgi:AICAR transformylase/IMP cyclohydrolase PurH
MDHQKRALFSLFEPQHCTKLAAMLAAAGWDLIATKETREHLAEIGIKARSIEDFVGFYGNCPFPPTLHPKIELVLTTESKEKIDLIFDQTYGSDKGLDVGGHTLIALALKGDRIVILGYPLD